VCHHRISPRIATTPRVPLQRSCPACCGFSASFHSSRGSFSSPSLSNSFLVQFATTNLALRSRHTPQEVAPRLNSKAMSTTPVPYNFTLPAVAGLWLYAPNRNQVPESVCGTIFTRTLYAQRRANVASLLLRVGIQRTAKVLTGQQPTQPSQQVSDRTSSARRMMRRRCR